jgi:hypothetical protein
LGLKSSVSAPLPDTSGAALSAGGRRVSATRCPPPPLTLPGQPMDEDRASPPPPPHLRSVSSALSVSSSPARNAADEATDHEPQQLGQIGGATHVAAVDEGPSPMAPRESRSAPAFCYHHRRHYQKRRHAGTHPSHQLPGDDEVIEPIASLGSGTVGAGEVTTMGNASALTEGQLSTLDLGSSRETEELLDEPDTSSPHHGIATQSSGTTDAAATGATTTSATGATTTSTGTRSTADRHQPSSGPTVGSTVSPTSQALSLRSDRFQPTTGAQFVPIQQPVPHQISPVVPQQAAPAAVLPAPPPVTSGPQPPEAPVSAGDPLRLRTKIHYPRTTCLMELDEDDEHKDNGVREDVNRRGNIRPVGTAGIGDSAAAAAAGTAASGGSKLTHGGGGGGAEFNVLSANQPTPRRHAAEADDPGHDGRTTAGGSHESAAHQGEEGPSVPSSSIPSAAAVTTTLAVNQQPQPPASGSNPQPAPVGGAGATPSGATADATSGRRLEPPAQQNHRLILSPGHSDAARMGFRPPGVFRVRASLATGSHNVVPSEDPPTFEER